MTSISTMGLVDYRSDKERTAKYTRQTRNAARAAARFQAALARSARHQTNQTPVAGSVPPQQLPPQQLPPPVPVPPGWYPDAMGTTRWWDGVQWTPATR